MPCLKMIKRPKGVFKTLFNNNALNVDITHLLTPVNNTTLKECDIINLFPFKSSIERSDSSTTNKNIYIVMNVRIRFRCFMKTDY